MSDPTIVTKITIPHSVLLEILTTAAEGGSAYWLGAHSIKRDKDLNVLSIVGPLDAGEDMTPFDATLFASGLTSRDITPDVVLEGIERLMAGALPGRDDLRAEILKTPSDTHDLDAEAADVIVQLGFFGDTVFG